MKKGFTLLELLIVIGILAILSTTMILVINPAELLKKARDSQRMSDLSTVKTAIAYYLTNASTISMGSTVTAYSSIGTLTGGCPQFTTPSATTSQAVDGTGWIPISFSGLTGGSPIGGLPADPNTTVMDGSPTCRYYVYLTSATTTNGFELVANLESTYYSSTANAESTDGGKIATLYEVGSSFDLAATSTHCFPNTGY
jgi:prepilin-type N-terminal cleavage/methylation domain-containing protein